MKINLIVAALLALALGCRKVDNRLTGNDNGVLKGTNTFALSRIDNISFTNDNGLLISGVSKDKYTLIKTDANLKIEWKKNDFDWGNLFSSSGWEAPFYSVKMVKVFQREDGNYVGFGAISEGGGVVSSSVLIIVLDKNGKQLKKYRFDNTDVANVLKTGSGYILFGNQLMKLDNNFNKLRTKNIYSYPYSAYAIAATTGGGFVVTGSYNFDQAFLGKIDANGNEVFKQTYKHNESPFEEAGFDIIQLADAGFLIVGRTGAVTASSNNIINCQMIRTNSKGDTLWTKRWGYSVNSWMDQIVSDDQDELILKGTIGYPTDSIQKNVLIKINTEGEILNSKITDNFLLLIYSPTNVYVKAENDGLDAIKVSVINEDELFN